MAELGARADGRDNNITLIRFLAATLVLFSHSYPLSGTPGEPLERFAGFSLGHLGVDVFFVISGFLVTRSLLVRRRLGEFVQARALRIYPALVAASLGCAFVVGPLVTRLPRAAYLARPGTWRYALQDAIALPYGLRYTLPGVFERLPVRGVVNGSLWSLPWELSMYALLALLGTLALVRPRPLRDARLRVTLVAIAVAATLGFGVNEALALARTFTLETGPRLLALFFTGAAAYVLRARVRLSLTRFVAAAALLAVALRAGGGLLVLYVPCLAYVVLWLAYVPAGPLRAYNRLGDYSYGLYLYAFPIQQCVMLRLPGASQLRLFAFAWPLTLAVAVASWHLLESPALARKPRVGG